MIEMHPNERETYRSCHDGDDGSRGTEAPDPTDQDLVLLHKNGYLLDILVQRRSGSPGEHEAISEQPHRARMRQEVLTPKVPRHTKCNIPTSPKADPATARKRAS